MVILRPAAPPPNPAAIHELKSRSMSLFRLWLREGLPPLPAFLLKHQVLLQAPGVVQDSFGQQRWVCTESKRKIFRV